MFSYHLHIQMALISQGFSQYLSTQFSDTAWGNLGSWLRTVRPGVPASVQVTQESLRNSCGNFRETLPEVPEWQKFAKSGVLTLSIGSGLKKLLKTSISLDSQVYYIFIIYAN